MNNATEMAVARDVGPSTCRQGEPELLPVVARASHGRAPRLRRRRVSAAFLQSDRAAACRMTTFQTRAARVAAKTCQWRPGTANPRGPAFFRGQRRSDHDSLGTSGPPVRPFAGHTGGLTSVALRREAALILIPSLDNSAVVRNAVTGEKVVTSRRNANAVRKRVFSRCDERALSGVGGL